MLLVSWREHPSSTTTKSLSSCLSAASQLCCITCGLYCQQGGRTERADKEFTASIVEVGCSIDRNVVTDTAVTGGVERL